MHQSVDYSGPYTSEFVIHNWFWPLLVVSNPFYMTWKPVPGSPWGSLVWRNTCWGVFFPDPEIPESAQLLLDSHYGFVLNLYALIFVIWPVLLLYTCLACGTNINCACDKITHLHSGFPCHLTVLFHNTLWWDSYELMMWSTHCILCSHCVYGYTAYSLWLPVCFSSVCWRWVDWYLPLHFWPVFLEDLIPGSCVLFLFLIVFNLSFAKLHIFA